MATINSSTKNLIEDLASSNNITVIWDKNPDSPIQEEVNRERRVMKLKENIKSEDFDYLFSQHNIDYPVERNQEMFLFNALHGIGHFQLELWKPKTRDPISDRLVNFDQDLKVDKWAYEELLKMRSSLK